MELERDYKRVNQYSSPEVTRHVYNERTQSALDQLQKKAQYAYQFRGEETGLYHPSESSVIKMKNSGDIDVFVENNVGMSIHKRLETVTFMANKMKQHLHDSKRWLTGDDTSYIKGDQLTKVVGNVTLEGKKNLIINIDKNILQSSETLTINVEKDAEINVLGNVTAKVGQHAKIDVENDLIVRANGNIDLEARGYARIDGSVLFIGERVF